MLRNETTNDRSFIKTLSKSKLMAYCQCPKRLWLALNKAEDADDSKSQMAFAAGHAVGEVAQKVFDSSATGVNVDPNLIGWGQATAQTAQLMESGTRPVFEAVFRIKGALALADIMLPMQNEGRSLWHMIEVKSSTELKGTHIDDIAVQTYLAKASGVQLGRVSLAHIDKEFVYAGDGDYNGLFKLVDLTDEVASRRDWVEDLMQRAQAVAQQEWSPIITMGRQCKDPYPCPFTAYCKLDSEDGASSLDVLPRVHWKRREKWAIEGIRELHDIPAEELSEMQEIVRQATMSGKVYTSGKKARALLGEASLPAYFLDFETINHAVPRHSGTRPYQQIPFQYSLHCLKGDGALEHYEFLDTSGDDPRPELVKNLIMHAGKKGPIYVYNASMEQTVLNQLSKASPENSAELQSLSERIVDLLPVARSCYYNPRQEGSWSLKDLLPAMCPELGYSQLDDEVQDGTAAMKAYLEAIDRQTTADRRGELRQRLLEYCKLDTLATVRLLEYLNKAQ